MFTKATAMASYQSAEVSVRILIDEEKNRVVCAEAGNDFVDILFSFLTLPMGTIVRLIRKQQAEIGCLNSLYQSVENLSTAKLWTDACKDMLLNPKIPCETICRGLKANVDDTEPTKYFMCSDLACNRTCSRGKLLSNYANGKCICGELMNREIHLLGSGSSANADGIFIKGSTAYIVSDNLKVMVSTPGALVELLGNLGIQDVNSLQERVLKVSSEKILNLLERSLLSGSPLTDVFLANEKFNSKSGKLDEPRRDHQFLSQNIAGGAATSTIGSMEVKIWVRKSDGKALYAETMEDFVDLLFSFLTIPLGNVVGCLDGDSSLGCIDNLYRSIQGLNNKWFVSHVLPWTRDTSSSNHLLLNPGLAPKFSCSSQPFELEERTPKYYYRNEKSENGDVDSLTFFSCYGDQPLTLIDPKSSSWATNCGEYVRRPAVFLVSDGLQVSGTTASISYLKELDVSIQDIEEQVLQISKQEALNLLKASLITTSALTNVLKLVAKKPKQES